MLKPNVFGGFEKSEVGHFAIDTIKNCFWFCLIGLAALGLHWFIKWAADHGAPALVVFGLTGVEYAVLGADLVWFVARVFASTTMAVVRAWREVRALLREQSGTKLQMEEAVLVIQHGQTTAEIEGQRCPPP